MEESRLVKIYCSLIRSVIEYAAQLYHHALTNTQSERLERLQRMCLKTIYGFGYSYREALEKSGLPRLNERRKEICKTFAEKTATNPRYDHWFPKKRPGEHDLRKRPTYEEKFAATTRQRTSPIFSMRRILNGGDK